MELDSNARWLKTSEEIFPHRPHAMTLAFQTEQYRYRMHEHDFYEINIILEGSGYHYIESRQLKVNVGDMFVIPPGVLHGYENIDPVFNVFHLVANKNFFTKYAEEIKLLGQFKVLFEIEPYLRANERNFYINLDYDFLTELKSDITILESIKSDVTDESDTIRNIITLKIISSLCRYAKQNSDRINKNEPKEYQDIMRALEYIHNNYSEKITIPDLAKLCNVSKATFLRKFKSVTKTSPNKYLLFCRAKNARRLLDGGLSRTATAQLCGFFDISHMDRVLSSYDNT